MIIKQGYLQKMKISKSHQIFNFTMGTLVSILILFLFQNCSSESEFN